MTSYTFEQWLLHSAKIEDPMRSFPTVQMKIALRDHALDLLAFVVGLPTLELRLRDLGFGNREHARQLWGMYLAALKRRRR